MRRPTLHPLKAPMLKIRRYWRARGLGLAQPPLRALRSLCSRFPLSHIFHPLLSQLGSEGPPIFRVSHALSSSAVARCRPLTERRHPRGHARGRRGRLSGSTGLLWSFVGHSTRHTADAPPLRT